MKVEYLCNCSAYLGLQRAKDERSDKNRSMKMTRGKKERFDGDWNGKKREAGTEREQSHTWAHWVIASNCIICIISCAGND